MNANGLCEILEQHSIPQGALSLVGGIDASATNVKASIVAIVGEGTVTILKAKYPGQDIEDFNEQVVDDMVRKAGVSKKHIEKLTIAAAGPVEDGRCRITYAKFEVDAATTGIDTVVFNDFVGNSYGVIYGQEIHLEFLELKHTSCSKGIKDDKGNMVVFGPGTGLGVARIDWDEDLEMYIPIAKEGGHVGLPADNASDQEIFDWISEKYFDGQPLHREAILCGDGITRILSYYREHLTSEDAGKYSQQFKKYDSESRKGRGAAYIAGQAKKHYDSIFGKTMDFFYKYLGKVGGDIATDEIARGGAYITGGVFVPNIQTDTDSGKLDTRVERIVMKAFDRGASPHKVKKDGYARTIPVYAVIDPFLGMKGATYASLVPQVFDREKHKMNAGYGE